MSAAFDDVRLPEEVEQGSYGGPGFQTSIIGMSSGQEQRNQDWSECRCAFDITYGLDSKTFFGPIIEFFRARRGRARGFRFKDWSDFQGTAEPIGSPDGSAHAVFDGSTATFQLIKTYEASGPAPYFRKITRPVTGTVTVTVNGSPETHWSLDYSTGLMTFAGGHIPTVGQAVLVTFEFDVPVRFDADNMQVVSQQATAGSINDLTIIELRE